MLGEDPYFQRPPPIPTRSTGLDPTSSDIVHVTTIYVTPDVVDATTDVSLVDLVAPTALYVMSLVPSPTAAVLSLMSPEVTALRYPPTC